MFVTLRIIQYLCIVERHMNKFSNLSPHGFISWNMLQKYSDNF